MGGEPVAGLLLAQASTRAGAYQHSIGQADQNRHPGETSTVGKRRCSAASLIAHIGDGSGRAISTTLQPRGTNAS